MTAFSGDREVLVAGTPIDERETQLAEGADDLAEGRPPLASNPRVTLAVSGALMTMGITAILLGWFGAAQSTLLEEQVPYLISGGLLGVALSTIGALLFFSHWLAVSIREARAREAARRRDHEELIGVLQGLASSLPAVSSTNGRARTTRARTERPAKRAASKS